MSTQPNLPMIMPITIEAHQVAQRYSGDALPQSAKHIYLNTLAIAVVSDYLNALGITTDPAQSDSTNIVLRTLTPTAALYIPNWGQLECRPVLPTDTHCYVPPELWEERRGYVAVQFNAELTDATLIGYLPVVADEFVPLQRFKPIEALVEAISSTLYPLSQWFNDIIATGWETVEALFHDHHQPALAFRAVHHATHPTLRRGKWIQVERGEHQIALLIELTQTPDPDLDIAVQVFPQRDRILPNDLTLAILDNTDQPVMQALAKESPSLSCEFTGQPGEQFSVKLKMGEFSLVEAFLI
ncbi:DUF1822 family protein [Spirulina major]|uniref:DUF1822 family protein n=1 Tax=Spirulina major TaxID=270636 RepID=UPI000934ABF6|nr:DUF1822 family protein [Spirulina major]